MKRSEINIIIKDSIQLFNHYKFKLPLYGYYNLDDWRTNKENNQEIFETGLGWDITDFGLADFKKYGLTLFTLRNGMPGSNTYPKSYAEKIMIGKVGQITPLHYHLYKMEDIINRGGGILSMQVYLADKRGEKTDKDVELSFDGTSRTLKAGSWINLKPGQSVTLPPFVYHRFHAELNEVLIGEVSMVNNDHQDNFFHDKIGRFPDIEEDEVPAYLLVNDYKRFLI